MLIDSGSKHNITTDKTWEYLKSQKVQAFNQKKNPNQVLKPHGSNKSLTIIGSFETKISLNGKNLSTKIYVIKDGSRNLLGKNTVIAVGVLKLRINVNNISTEFPKFKNISVEIPIDRKEKPVMQPHRRIPIPLKEKVNSKLEEFQNSIIEEVKGTSKWVPPMVPILKENDEVRICIDMRRANAAIKRENHPQPTMLLPNLRGAKYFSGIKNAFNQIEIHENSRYYYILYQQRII
uniref:Reverse transcriptase domain-containing protein n=1 Tax=Trichogramma kaykai TaxID=54128 RepID=A0ABD2VUW4_9HYME